jgi:tripartite-type tricarboxylate transporter receptor subunit TctC
MLPARTMLSLSGMPAHTNHDRSVIQGYLMSQRSKFHFIAQFVCSAAAASFLCFGDAQAADTFPSNTIRIVVPTSAATPPDIICRVIAAALSEAEGWKVIVENKPGAIGTIAGLEVLKQPADGYTLYPSSLPVVAGPALLPNISYRLDTDFAPLIKLSVSYNVLVVNPSVPAKSIADLVAYLKASDGNHNFSSGGFGTPAHLIGELFKLQTGVPATHIPYNAMPQAIGDLIGGTNQFMFVTTLPVIQLINGGQLRALAVTAPKRIPVLKDVPSVAEEGYPNLVVEDWVGLSVKAGTPPEIVARLNAAINKALATPSVREALAKIGAEPAGGTPEAFGTQFNQQLAHWAKVVKESGIKMQQQ